MEKFREKIIKKDSNNIAKIKNVLSEYKAMPLDTKFKAAVIILLIDIDGEESIIFEKRSKYISQPGEISLPGGKVESGESFYEAALREAYEEINVESRDVEYLGETDYLVNGNGLIIKPFVGRVKNYSLDDFKENREIENIFTVPLKYFIENPPKIYKNITRIDFNKDFPFELVPNGRDYNFSKVENKVYFYENLNPVIWGYTARIINRFIEIITKREEV